MDLTVVVPVYNAEKHIERCLSSLVNQNIQKDSYEIIVINDGSTDGSLAIIENLNNSHENILVYNQENRGLGAVRNRGIILARGKYIYFLDSDDYIAHNTLNTLIDYLKEFNLDIIGFQSIYYTDKSNLINSETIKLDSNPKVLSGIDFLQKHPDHLLEAWWYITKRDFLLKTGHKFIEEKFFEDAMFTFRIFLDAERTIFLNFDVHRYVDNPTSIMNMSSSDHLKKFLDDWISLIFELGDLKREMLHLNHSARYYLADMVSYRQALNVHYMYIRLVMMDTSLKKMNQLLRTLRKNKILPLKFTKEQYKKNGLPFKLSVFIFNQKYLYFLFLYPSRFLYRRKFIKLS